MKPHDITGHYIVFLLSTQPQGNEVIQMLLRTIATGSSGNSYALISNTGEILLLDLGVSEKTIKRVLIGKYQMLLEL